MICKYPASFARFYDTIYHQVRDSTDHKYFLEKILKTRGRVLEVGVGTGRLFNDALKQGADIYGLDISESMLDVLYSKIPSSEHHRLSLQNITDFRYDFGFDLIIAPFRVMMHLSEKQEQILALNNVFNHLNKGGLFIFDTFIPDLNQLINGLDNRLDFEGDYIPGKKVRRIVTTTPDLINQTITVRFRLEWDEDDGVKTDDWTVPMRFYFRYELEHLAERSEFKDYRIAGNYNEEDLDSNSKDFIVICKK